MKRAVPLMDRDPFFKTTSTRARLCRVLGCAGLASLLICGGAGEAQAQKRRPNKVEIKQSRFGGEILKAQTRGELNGLISRSASQGLVTGNLMEELQRCLAQGSTREQNNCAYALSLLVEPKYAPIVLPRLQRTLEFSENTELRTMAATAIGRLEAKGAPATALLEDEVTETRQAAILALAEVGYAAAAPELEKLLKHSSEVIRLTSAKSLCKLDQPAGRRFAEALLANPDDYARKDAVWILSGLKPKWTADAIASLLGDKALSVQIEAAKALSTQKDMRGTRWLVLSAQKATEAEDYALVNRLEQAIEDAKVPAHQRKAILTEAGKGKKAGGKR